MQNDSPAQRRAIFIDVDGTLMDHEIVDPTAPPAIAQARANGHLVFVCTGRSFKGLDPAMSDLEFDGWVTSGGASARIGSVIVHHRTMGTAAVHRMIDFFTEHNIAYILEADDGVYCSGEVRAAFEAFWSERLKQHAAELERLGLPNDEVASPTDNADRGSFEHFLPLEQANFDTVSKATFLSSQPNSYDLTVKHLGSEYHLVPGSIPMPGGSSGEIATLGITKATGIAAVLAELGMSPDDAIGIGDSWNDKEMFELCGVAVAMGNAPAELRALADFTTTPVLAGGIRDALIRLNLI